MKRQLGMCAAAAFTCIGLMNMSAARAQTAAPVGSPQPEVAAVQKVIEGFIDRLSPFFASDATMFFPLAPLSLRLENKEQITKVFTVFFESVRKGKTGPQYMNLAPQDLRIQLYGNTAVVTFHFKGPDLISRRTLVLERTAGKWLIVHMHASGLPVPKE